MIYGIKPNEYKNNDEPDIGGLQFKRKSKDNFFTLIIKKMIISEENKVYMYWRILPAISSIISSVFAMYHASFRIHMTAWDFSEYSGFDMLELAVEAIFCLDIILPFFREYKDEEGHVVREIETIIWNNLIAGTFFYDLLAQLPFRNFLNLIFNKDRPSYTKYTRYLMLLELLKLMRLKMALATLTPLNIKILV